MVWNSVNAKLTGVPNLEPSNEMTWKLERALLLEKMFLKFKLPWKIPESKI
jgi:hypothetical protein